ncbi:Aste57867_18734 [Aphanomyces stellatus]|uniref:Aste57867_18734 protein n=1 Tax=Aphanomyces stellatus TaxID=120398 RepID=A0A485LAW9_9STRA|nr:hypothetical protein As57867_018670 [Aphanomyces stellatus]VFT95468.1 Aste57867_18734 [Aphanomyces stellatus]
MASCIQWRHYWFHPVLLCLCHLWEATPVGPPFPSFQHAFQQMAPPPRAAPRPSNSRWGSCSTLPTGFAGSYFNCIGNWLARSADRAVVLERSTTSILLLVSLLVLVNVPALVLVALFDFNVVDKNALFLTYSLSKAGSYAIGAGLACILGLYLKDFDALYVLEQTKGRHPRDTAVVDSVFVVLDASRSAS